MKFFTLTLSTILSRVSRHPDLVMAIGLSGVMAMLLIPLPTWMIDLVIPLNIAGALLVLLVTIFTKRALDMSSFPTMLLLATLLRLGLNVSTTRGILADADAGTVVKAFGDFVVRGDVVLGFVMFLVITLVQFLVVAKGAERVAEVSARFTLDAMPGKQMSIDAAMRSGAITEEGAQTKRDELNRLSMLFGNMDGAMKFVKGDTIAGLIITAINVVAGVIIGVTRMDMEPMEALETYATLTVGDGLVAQISALIIALAAGVMITRVEPENEEENLGHVLKREMFSNQKALFVGAGLMSVLGLVPGLPALPFFAIAAVVSGIGCASMILPVLKNSDSQSAQEAFKEMIDRKVEETKMQRSISDQLAPVVVPIGIDLDPALSEALGFGAGAMKADPKLIDLYIPQLRDALYLETGVRFPGVRVRPHVRKLPENTYLIRIDDVPMLQGTLTPGTLVATAPPARLERLGVEAEPIVHPVNNMTMSVIREEDCETMEASGVHVWDLAGVLSLYLGALLRRRAKDFLGIQDVATLVERLEEAYPALVKEVVPKAVSVQQVLAVLRRLADERVSIRNMRVIMEALGEYGPLSDDTVFLTEKVRGALGAQLAHAHAGVGNPLSVVLLDGVIEDTVAGGIRTNHHGHSLALQPELCSEIIQSIIGALRPVVERGKRPVLLTNGEIRRYVRKLIEIDLPEVSVLSFDELPVDLSIQPMGRACIEATV